MVAVTHTLPDAPYAPGTVRGNAREEYAARRTYAYEIGEGAALQRRVSAEAYLFLYKELVRLCKERTSCWAGVTWMSERLGVSVGTIKRWLRQLVDAGLIERTQRSGGDTALTRIPALVAYDAERRQVQPPATSSESPSDEPPALVASDAAPTQPLFFAPAEGITHESSIGSDLIRSSIKRQKRISGLVGGSAISGHNERPERPGLQSFAMLGICGPGVLDELSGHDPDELAAICRYVERQRNSYNPAGLAVFLARSGFGRTLLRPKPVEGKRSAIPCAARSLIAPSVPDGANSPESVSLALRPLDDLWSQVQANLAHRVPEHEFTTWLQETQLVALDQERAVIGVPNVFAREQVQAAYGAAIQDAVADLAGKSVAVEVVIEVDDPCV